jgi:23S rRNA (cytosine1962-C5)-methyltransferase
VSCPELVLRANREHSLVNGHPWVYSGAVAQAPTGVSPGDTVEVRDHRGRFLGRGCYNPQSTIVVRLLSRDPDQAIDRAFFRQAIERAWQLRRQAPQLADTSAFRLVHGESDGLPGLVVDQYADWLVVQFHTLGMERWRREVLDALEEVVRPRGVYERSDVGTRRADGLRDRPTGPLRGQAPPEYIEIVEHGVPLWVDVYRGQKTGFFLDQRDNRALLRAHAPGRSLLNCFAYSSAFSAHALAGGAVRTLDVDLSTAAAATARLNLAANRRDGSTCHYAVADVFPLVEELAERGPRFDLVVLDPPSLLRRSADHAQAMGVYTKLNRNGLRLVRAGGLLVTASCSARISAEDFTQVLHRASVGARVATRILAFRLHPADHPVDPAFPEGRYLKCIFARVER